MGTAEILSAKREDILSIAARHGAHNVRIFGSMARGEATESSDVDFLIDLEPNKSLFELSALLVELEELLGRKVDLITEDSIYWLLRRRILKEAVPL